MSQQFIWKEEYQFGFKEIDSQHQYFVSLINELYDAILNLEAKTKLSVIFTKLTAYAVNHFATEEKYFKEFNYAGAAEHIAEHKALTEKIAVLQAQIDKDQLELSFDLIDFLEDWLLNHLSTMDAKYVSCFKEHGLK